MHAREPADRQFQARHAAMLPGAADFAANLVDQGLDDGQFVHGGRQGQRGEGFRAGSQLATIYYTTRLRVPLRSPRPSSVGPRGPDIFHRPGHGRRDRRRA